MVVSHLSAGSESCGRRLPLSGWLKLMGKTKHLCKPENEALLASIEVEVERRWQRLKAKDENPLL